jgi:pSer/pThr/pTyr-binding forkhead associated (FHA) protein
LFDLVRNDWIELSVPAGQTIQATGLPASPEPGFTPLVLTDNEAYTYDVGTDQWIGHTLPGPVRSFAVAEASPVVASDHAVAVYDPVTNQWVQQDVGPSGSIPRNGVLASRNTALAVTAETGYIYNRSRHQWEQVPAPANEAFSGFAVAENTGVFWTPEGTAYVWDVNRQQFIEGAAPPNVQIVSGTMNQNLAVVTTDQGAMIYDPGTNQWSHFQVPMNDIPTPPGAPNFSISRFTTLLTTDTNAYVWNQGTHQFDQVTTCGNLRLVQTSENAAVVATDDGAYVYDSTLNQWVEVQTPLVNEPIVDAVYASGGTPLYMSIGVAYDLMEKKASADSGGIIVLTDGGESCQDDEDRSRAAASSWRQRRIPWVRRTQKQSSAAPRTIAGLGAAIARDLFLPGQAYAQQAPGKINPHLVGFQIEPEVEAQIQEMMGLAQGQYYPAGDVNSLTQALRTAVGTGTTTTPTGGGNAALPLLIVIFMVALAAIFFFIWQMSSRRQTAPAMGPGMGHAGQLVVTRGQAARPAVGLDRPLITIGRDPASSLVVMDPQVSRNHAQLRRQNGGAILYDLGSVNGTYVNGQRVAGAQPLNPGDIIKVGNTELSYQPGGMAPPRTPYGAPTGAQAPGVGAWITIVQGTGQPPTLDLQRKPYITLGRDPTNDVVIAADSQVSRLHAQIRAVAGGYEIMDMGSANGLFVNGQRVPRAILRPGDRIRLGNTECVHQG